MTDHSPSDRSAATRLRRSFTEESRSGIKHATVARSLALLAFAGWVLLMQEFPRALESGSPITWLLSSVAVKRLEPCQLALDLGVRLIAAAVDAEQETTALRIVHTERRILPMLDERQRNVRFEPLRGGTGRTIAPG